MNWFENISLSLTHNSWIFILGVILIFSYTIFIYRTTLPQIGKIAKSFLVFIRSFALLLILLLLFDPILKISTSEKVEPNNLIFIDNSKSINEFSSKDEKREIINLVNKLNSDLDGNKQFFTFGSEINELIIERFDSINFASTSTNLISVIEQIKKSQNPSSALIITDGIINDGTNPKFEIEKLNVPIYSVAVGDTSIFADLSVQQIRSNEFVYAARETEIEVLLKNEMLSNNKVKVNLYVDEQFSKSENIELSSNGINRIKFPIKLSEPGEHKISVRTNASGDNILSNNIKSTIINVLETKKKISIVAGSPSRDLSIITKSIERNDDYDLAKIIEISNNRLNRKDDYKKIIRDSDILFLVGFPNENSDNKFIAEIKSIVEETNKPLFISFTESLDFNKMKLLSSILPFTINSISNTFSETQVVFNTATNSLISKSDNDFEAWNNLPPISLNRSTIVPSVSAEVLLIDNIRGKTPIIIKDQQANRKSISISAANIWRWKLTSSNKASNLFDEFLLNSIKWLSLDSDDKNFNIKLDKRNYKIGETVTFTATLYDETLEPLNSEKIKLIISDGENTKNLIFSPIGNGLYEAIVNFNIGGIKNYSAKIEDNIMKLPTISGSFNVEPIELELVERKLNSTFLELISNISGGKYSTIKRTEYLVDELNSNYNNSIYSKIIDNELRLSTFELILLIIVMLFSVEWITRKLLRMI